MRLELLLQFLVPLAIMAMWALTSLLARDTQPLPARPDDGSSRRPMPGPTNSASRRPEPFSHPRATTQKARAPLPSIEANGFGPRPEKSMPVRPPSPRGLNAEDGIVILDSDSRGPRSFAVGPPAAPPNGVSRPGRTNPSKRGARPRSSATGPQARVNPATPRALTALVNESIAQNKSKHLEIAPLASAANPLRGVSSPAAVIPARDGPSHAPVTRDDILALVHSADRLREATLLSEILQPPLARRALRRR